MRVAFYKAIRPGWQGLYSRAVRWWTRSPYSHAEIVFSDGMSASSSLIDGGVRFKQIEFNPEHWDFIEICGNEVAARLWFREHEGAPYDVLGNVRFVLQFLPDGRRKWFCSEAIAAALGLPEPWRYDPAILRSAVSQSNSLIALF